jgi:hypothetical protein
MKIAFHDNILSLRGTTIAIYDWAYWSRYYLEVDPIIMFNINYPQNNEDVYKKFESQFSVFGYYDKSEIDKILEQNECDYFFMMKSGNKDGVISSVCKNLVSATSSAWTSDWIHGDVYAMCSEWLSKLTNFTVPCVPHIVNLPDIQLNMREELNIPKDSLVIGRNGGWETFDISFVKEAIYQVLNERSDIWFIFQFTEPFIEHERVIYLPGTANLEKKVKFVNTCDAMIHARYQGESFGLSCAEFSIRNKPVITYYNSIERNHIDTLNEKGIYYENKKDIDHIFKNLDKKEINSLEWNCYQDYSPEKVIQKFKEVYLK